MPMLSLQQLQHQLKQSHAPVEQWDPPFCGDLDLRITADGLWLYQGSPIGRLALVKLFASVLVKEQQQYYLKTPVEKVRIQVEDAPFLISSWRWQPTDSGQALIVVTNLEQEVLLDHHHPTELLTYQQQDIPYIQLWRGLQARVSRSVYYQWVEAALQQPQPQPDQLWFHSAEANVLLGVL